MLATDKIILEVLDSFSVALHCAAGARENFTCQIFLAAAPQMLAM